MSASTIPDKGEAITVVEPLIPEEASKHRPHLNDLAVELASQSSGLRASLPEAIRAPLADLVRSMNCYYSNLIEGHNTHPIDIERAFGLTGYLESPMVVCGFGARAATLVTSEFDPNRRIWPRG